jgi:prolyl-tRNA synthetase
MTHADDDGMVIPPKLAPAHVAILPIYKNDEERAAVLPYCESLKADLEAQTYDGAAVRVKLDDRDIRGGDKKWQWVKRGVPIRAEIGPRDVKGEGVFVARRDIGGKGQGTPRGELVSGISAMLDEMQQNLYDRAAKLRDDASVEIDSMGEFEKFFADDAPGGLAYCHFVDGPEMEAKLKAMKLTARCIPLDAKTEKGKCIFTGADSERRGVFARAY